MALIQDNNLDISAAQVRLSYKAISPKGVTSTKELVYGRKNRVTPFLLKELKTAHNIVIDELDPDKLYIYSKVVLKNRVLGVYKSLVSSTTAAQQGKEFRKLNDNNEEKVADQFSAEQDYSDPPKNITLVDVFKTGGSTALVLAGSHSGKTTMLVHAINNIKKENHYDVIIVFSESINAEPLRDIKDKEVILANKFFPSIVTLAYQINKATKNRYRYLFILDDVYELRYNKVFQKMIVAYRNSGISTIICTQHSTIIPPAVRSSIHNIYFLGSKSETEKERAISEWLRGYIMARGIKNKDVMKDWFSNNTRIGKEGQDSGKYLKLDNIKADLSIQDRPKYFY